MSGDVKRSARLTGDPRFDLRVKKGTKGKKAKAEAFRATAAAKVKMSASQRSRLADAR